MKRFLLLLVAIATTTFCLNAQSVLKFTAIDNAIPAAGTEWSVDGCTMTWYDAPSADGIKANTAVTVGSETFEFSLQGVNNPKPWTYPVFGGSAMWLFDCTQNGTLTIVTAINAKKNTYIVETPIVADKTEGNYCYVLCGESGVTDYLFTDEPTFQAGAKFVTATTKVGDKLFNGPRSWDIWDVVEGNSLTMTTEERTAADDAAYAISNWIYDAITITAEAGKCYNYFCTGSKACIYGFIFTPEAVVVPVIDTTATVTFIVDDSANKTGADFKLRGSWITATGVYDPLWSGGADHTSFYDDGTHGDVTVGDHVWSVAVDLVANATVTWKWGFMVDGVWGVVGPDQQFTLPDSTNITVTYVIPKKVGVNYLNASTVVVKTEYFNLLGVKLSEPVNGVNIIRNTMSNGSIVIRKTLIRK
jgi:hypothetical protein